MFSISRACFFLVFYLIGMYTRDIYNKNGNNLFKVRKISVIISFVLILIYTFIVSTGVTINIHFNGLYLFICGILGAILLVYIVNNISHNSIIAKILLLLGKHSMDIYLFSWFFQIVSMIVIVEILNITNYNIFFISNILVGSLCLPFSIYIIRNVNIFKLLFLGYKI